ncbi:MAG: glycosyltransferase family 4 protein [Deltaproteobacteria bacterium]|nr:glycosyltransferase family 4 protein [Deltaproteobacteria bacterium]
MCSRIKVLVNAIPMVNVNTGISRYLRCLYAEMERCYGDKLIIGYFDGWRVSNKMPRGPANLGQWTKGVNLFWKMPVCPALVARLGIHTIREAIFRKVSRNFDIYHEAGFFPFLVPSETKIVFTIHDLSLMRFPRHHPRERVLFSRLFLKRRCRIVDRFLAVSQFTANEMRAYLQIDERMITITPEAQEGGTFYPRSYGKIKAFCDRYKLPEQYFLFVGSGDPRKNLEIVPRALEKADLDIPLAVVGWSGWAEQQAWKNVIPLGYISDDELAAAYSGACALIFPSSYEGFGLPVLEAMACGCPVITTKAASLPEVAGDAALYVEEPRNGEALVPMLKRVLLDQSLVERLRQKGKWQAKAFSWEKTAEFTFESFLEVLHR